MCDYGAGKVKVLDLERKRFYILGGDATPTTAPTNLCISADGYKFIVESMPALIQVFDPEDNYVATFKVKDGRPGGVAAVGAELFVTDVTHDRIQVLDRGTGKLLRTFGSKGQEPGQFLMPNAIAADAEGNLYVSDLMNFRFQKLDRNGKSLMSVGGAGDSLRQVLPPAGNRGRPGRRHLRGGIGLQRRADVQPGRQSADGVRKLSRRARLPGSSGVRRRGQVLPASILPSTWIRGSRRSISLFVTSQVGDARLGVYAFGHLKPGVEIPCPCPEPASEAGARAERSETPARRTREPPPRPTPAPEPAETQPAEKP